MIRFILLFLLGCPFIASYNDTQLIITKEQTNFLDVEAERLPIPESVAVKKISSDNTSSMEPSSTEGTAFASVQSLRETLLDTNMAEETDNSLLVQNELLSNYFGNRLIHYLRCQFQNAQSPVY